MANTDAWGVRCQRVNVSTHQPATLSPVGLSGVPSLEQAAEKMGGEFSERDALYQM